MNIKEQKIDGDTAAEYIYYIIDNEGFNYAIENKIDESDYKDENFIKLLNDYKMASKKLKSYINDNLPTELKLY